MSAHEIQMPGNYQKKEYSRIKNVFFFFIWITYSLQVSLK
jgi:hypothetical protein